MNVLPTHPEILDYLDKHQLTRKFNKQVKFLENNLKHPSLNVEKLEPKERGIYSFRVNLKYRALFIFRDDRKALEILTVTKHYH